ncbi:MAG: AMP-binding protein, partial [Anaerolineales bacterium]|nr:AMP-binding protein [Anaerolineales bacterium]
CRDLVGLRSHYQPEESFYAWLGRFGGMVATGRSHSALSSSELVQMLNLPRDQSRSAPFTAVVRELPAPPAPQFAGLTVEPGPLPWARARHDLEFLLLPVADGYELHCEYSSELFREETIAVWLEGWQALLAAGLADPEEPVSTLPMLSMPWRRQLLKSWNETERQLPPRTVLDGIAEGSYDAPEAIAIRHETGQLCYGQLWSRSGAIAAALAADGVGAGDRVGLLLGRTLDLLPAMLAAWRVWSAYVPLDRAFPAERLQYMH